jgi:hypothetical protein
MQQMSRKKKDAADEQKEERCSRKKKDAADVQEEERRKM